MPDGLHLRHWPPDGDGVRGLAQELARMQPPRAHRRRQGQQARGRWQGTRRGEPHEGGAKRPVAHPLARLRPRGREHRLRGDPGVPRRQAYPRREARPVLRAVPQRRHPRAAHPPPPEQARGGRCRHATGARPSTRRQLHQIQHHAPPEQRQATRRGRGRQGRHRELRTVSVSHPRVHRPAKVGHRRARPRAVLENRAQSRAGTSPGRARRRQSQRKGRRGRGLIWLRVRQV